MNKSFYFLLLILMGINSVFAQQYDQYKTLLDTTITSKYLGFDKKIRITVPYEWQADVDRTFPLIIVFDSQNQRSHQYILNTIDYLTINDQMPSAVVMSVESEQEYRYHETLFQASREEGLALENEQFIFNELIPLAEQKYHASDFRLLVGHSRYGYFTSALFCSKINALNAIISISPVFIQKNVDLTDSILNLQQLQLNSTKYYRFGIGNDYPDDFYKMDSAIQHFHHPLIDVKGFLFKEAAHNVTPGLTIGTSLYEIFEEWSRIQSIYFSNDQMDLKIINSLEDDILSHYGSRIEFSLGILNGKGWFFYNNGQYDKAIEAWEILLESYPNFSETYLYIMDAQLALGQDIAPTTALFKNSLKTTGIYSEEEKNELLEELESLIK